MMCCLPNVALLKEVALVKFVNPGEFILDLLPEDLEMKKEREYAEEHHELLNGYFRKREKEVIDGRKYEIGETVAVCLNSAWRPGMCTDLNIVNGSNIYEVLLMDSGQIIEVDIMKFRPLPFISRLPSRYNSFVLLHLLPIGRKESGLYGWSSDADEDMRLLIKLASRIFIVIKASYPLAGYSRLFGDVYVEVCSQLINLKQRLLEKRWAFEDACAFEREYKLCGKHFIDASSAQREEKPDVYVKQRIVVSPVIPLEITDNTLDNHLPEPWKTGGCDPITQVAREQARRKLIGEMKIGFGLIATQDNTQKGDELDTTEMENTTYSVYSLSSRNTDKGLKTLDDGYLPHMNGASTRPKHNWYPRHQSDESRSSYSEELLLMSKDKAKLSDKGESVRDPDFRSHQNRMVTPKQNGHRRHQSSESYSTLSEESESGDQDRIEQSNLGGHRREFGHSYTTRSSQTRKQNGHKSGSHSSWSDESVPVRRNKYQGSGKDKDSKDVSEQDNINSRVNESWNHRNGNNVDIEGISAPRTNHLNTFRTTPVLSEEIRQKILPLLKNKSDNVCSALSNGFVSENFK